MKSLPSLDKIRKNLKENKIALIVTVLIIIFFLYYTYLMIIDLQKLIDSIANTNINLLVLLILIFAYTFGSVYSVFDNIFSKSRELNQIIKDNDDNIKSQLMKFKYVSICHCLATVIKNLFSLMLIMMVSLMFNYAGIDKDNQMRVYEFINHYILSFTFISLLIAITSGFTSTKAMILFNNEYMIRKKVNKLLK